MASYRANYSSIRTSVSREEMMLPKLQGKQPFLYDSSNHLKVIFGISASVLPQTFPFALFYMALAYFFYFLKNNLIDLTVDSTGVKYLSTLVSFYLISATSIVLDRYFKSLAHCFGLIENTLGLAQTVVLFSQDKSNNAKQWRYDVCYQILNMIISALGALRYKSTGINVWEYRDLPPDERKFIKDNVISYGDKNKEKKSRKIWFAGKTRSMLDENFRAPFLMATKLRHVILDWRTRVYEDEIPDNDTEFEYLHKAATFMLPVFKEKLDKMLLVDTKKDRDKKRLTVPEELKLLEYVSNFLTHFVALKGTESTPLPFPFVKMRKVILFFWLALLPLAFLSDPSFTLIRLLVLTGIISGGFVGLEIVIMELVEPFGSNINNLNEVDMYKHSTTAILDALAEIDGDKAATSLQREFSYFFDKDL